MTIRPPAGRTWSAGSIPTAVTIGVDGAINVGEQRIAELAREVIQTRSRTDTFGPDADRAGSDS